MTLIDREHLALWQRLVPGGPDEAALLAALAGADVRDPATLARLRRGRDADVVRVAIELARARAKAARKFPNAADLAADVAGVEQATSAAVAAHKARRFATVGAERIVDLCCGIGGDAMALAEVGAVTAIDASPVRAWMAGHNARCASRADDVEAIPLTDDVFHLDPDRRTGPDRAWRYEDYRPGPAFIDRLLACAPDGAIKLGPGVRLDALPIGEPGAREVEIVSERGTLVQVVLWCGRLALHPGSRTATRLPAGTTLTAPPQPPRAAVADACGRWLVAVDPALERAGLVGAVVNERPLRELHPGLGLFTADEPPDSPWLTAWEVLVQMPWRIPKIRAWLAANDSGVVTVRTRGGAVETDRAQRELRGGGDEAFVVFGLRTGTRKIAIVTREGADAGPP